MKKYYTVSTLLATGILGVGFYWFQLRPAHIRQDCSWVKKHTDFVPEITQVEIDRRRVECSTNKIHGRIFCVQGLTPAQVARDWYEPASPSEYQFCIHSRGL